MIDRLKKAVIAATAMAVAAALAGLTAAFVLYALLSEAMDEAWAAALTAGTFAVVAGAAAMALKGAKSRDSHEDADGEHHGLAALTSGLPSSLSGAASQLRAMTKGSPMLLYGAGALAAIVLIRKPGLIWLIGSNLLGMRVQKRRDRKRGMWTRG